MNNVINIQTGTPVVTIKEQDWSEKCRNCYHTVTADMQRRLLQCSVCGRYIDPFDWACKMGRDESYLMSRINALQGTAQQAHERVEKLKDEEKRVKGRIAAAKKSLVDAAMK